MRYTQAPLSFIGQKRFFLNDFNGVLKQNIPDGGEGWTIVDVFGGSGLLAHNARQVLPNARVIYNDYDDYAGRLGKIDATNRLLRRLGALLADCPKETKLDAGKKAEVLQLLEGFQEDYDALSVINWLTFSGNSVKNLAALKKASLYNNLRKRDNPEAHGYLDGLEIVREDFGALMKKFHGDERALLVCDPPYLMTQQGSYKIENRFGLFDFLRLFSLLRAPFVYFSSKRSEAREFIDFWNAENPHNTRADGYQVIRRKSSINHNARYIDEMLYKF